VKTRIIAHSQQVVRFDREVRFPLRSASEKKIITRLDRLIPRVHGIIISDYAKGFITPNLARQVVALARKHRKPLMVDPKLANLRLFRRATVITPNHYEAGEACGLETESDAEVQKAGKKLLKELDCQAVLITRGEAGMTLIERNKPVKHILAQAREVFDVTGAGDTVISAFTIGAASGMSFYLAACLANVAAGIGVGKLGTSVVSHKELREALENQGL
jgi:rfaE bifunctional protein kinase chain/domain